MRQRDIQSLSQNYVVTDMFDEPKTWEVEHIALAKKADVFQKGITKSLTNIY